MHIQLWLSLGYLIGAIFHLLMRADFARKSKVNPFPGMWAWFVCYWVQIAVRVGFWGYGLFWLWLDHPDWPAKIAMQFYVPPDVANWLIVTPTLGASVGFGFFADVALDYTQVFVGALAQKFPSLGWLGTLLQSQVPQYSPEVQAAVDVVENQQPKG